MTECRMFSFPWLHPKLNGHLVPEDVVWLDPGVDMPGESRRYRPENLPFSAPEVRRMLHDYRQFGERFTKPADMSTYQAVGLENFYTDTTMDIFSQLRGVASGELPEVQDRRKQAQLVLAMALYREEQFVAMQEQSVRFAQARDGFAEVLGLDEDELFVDQGVPDSLIVPQANVDLPWTTILPSFLMLLPSAAKLFVADPDVADELRSSGVVFAPCAEAGRSCGLLEATHVEQLCGIAVDPLAPISVFIPALVEKV